MLQREDLSYHRLWFIIGCLLILLIGYKSLEPIKIEVDGFEQADLVLHFLAYFTLTGWFQQLYTRSAMLPIALLVVIYSGLLEIAQQFVPIREPNLMDFLANTAAAVLATLVNYSFMRNALKFFETRFMPA